MSIRYSDGEAVEARILRILEAQKVLHSEHALASEHYGEWAVRYHLCPERANLLRHLDFSGLDVLEMGAGMGGVSRFLAESARSLTVIEGTQARFAALSSRLRDLKNWSGVVGNIQDVTLDRKFDVVCVIGVMEYSELFIAPSPATGESPFDRFLKAAMSHLKEDGTLILAIENRLGLKYWSGAPEDHTNQLFDSICGYSAGKTAKTFSRQELMALFKKAGLSAIDEHYPFPDYKIPTTVLSKRFIDSSPQLCAEIASAQSYRSYVSERVTYFPDPLALEGVAKAGLLAEFSNSFLFLGSRSEASPIRRKLLARELGAREAGWHYSLNRKIPTRTTFRVGDRSPTAEKALLSHSPRDDRKSTYSSGSVEVLWSPLSESPMLQSPKLRSVLMRQAYFQDWNGFMDTLDTFFTWAMQKWKASQEGFLQGDALDGTLHNIALGENGSFEAFDLEWKLQGQMPVSWFVFRNAFAFLNDVELLLGNPHFRTLKEFYEHFCSRLGIQPRFDIDCQSECLLQAAVTPDARLEQHRANLERLFSVPLEGPRLPRNPDLERVRLQSIRSSELAGSSEAISRLAHKINGVLRRANRARQVAKRILTGAKSTS